MFPVPSGAALRHSGAPKLPMAGEDSYKDDINFRHGASVGKVPAPPSTASRSSGWDGPPCGSGAPSARRPGPRCPAAPKPRLRAPSRFASSRATSRHSSIACSNVRSISSSGSATNRPGQRGCAGVQESALRCRITHVPPTRRRSHHNLQEASGRHRAALGHGSPSPTSCMSDGSSTTDRGGRLVPCEPDRSGKSGRLRFRTAQTAPAAGAAYLPPVCGVVPVLPDSSICSRVTRSHVRLRSS